MDNLRQAILRWRHLVLVAELLTTAGFAGLGWQLVHTARPASDPIALDAPPLHTPRLHAARIPSRYSLTGSQDAVATLARTTRRTARLPSPSADFVRSLNEDDLVLYRQQWRAIQALSDGIRRYLERWVLPPLFDPGLRG